MSIQLIRNTRSSQSDHGIFDCFLFTLILRSLIIAHHTGVFRICIVVHVIIVASIRLIRIHGRFKLSCLILCIWSYIYICKCLFYIFHAVCLDYIIHFQKLCKFLCKNCVILYITSIYLAESTVINNNRKSVLCILDDLLHIFHIKGVDSVQDQGFKCRTFRSKLSILNIRIVALQNCLADQVIGITAVKQVLETVSTLKIEGAFLINQYCQVNLCSSLLKNSLNS